MKIVNDTKRKLKVLLLRRIDDQPSAVIYLDAGKISLDFEGIKSIYIKEVSKHEK